MFHRNYSTTILLAFFIGSISTPSIGMEIQRQNQEQFDQAKQLIDAFFVARFIRRSDSKLVHYKEEMHGFDFYLKAIENAEQKHKNLKQTQIYKLAQDELLAIYGEEQTEINEKPFSTMLEQKLYFDAIHSRDTDDSNE